MAYHSITELGDARRALEVPRAEHRRTPVRSGRPSFAAALVIAAVLVAGAQRGFAQPGHDAEDVWLGLALSAASWSWLCLGFGVAQRYLPRALALVVGAGLAAIFYFSFCAELIYTYFYDAAQDRELSVLSVGLWTGLRVLFGQLLVPSATWLLGAMFAFAHLAALWLSSRGPVLPARRGVLGLVATFVLTLGSAACAFAIDERVRSPVAEVGRELVFLARTPRLDPKAAPRLPYEVRVLDKSRADDPTQAYTFDYVLVFVMETMIVRDLEAESSRLPAHTFLRRALPNSHRYLDYHGNNQDSRTGMLDMLTSRVIPYEAYADGVEHYRFLARLPSLVDRFNTRGYASTYAVSHADREDVFADLPWRNVLLLPNAEVDALRSKMLCVTVYEFEYGCEDLALLPKIQRVLDEQPKAFVFQEFIWGHDPEYNEQSGRSNADYYSSYLDAVVQHLAQTGKLDRTLIVLTSDHGYRGRSTLAEPYAYHLPLWFYATRFQAHTDSRLLSHIDFAEILLHELGAGPGPREAAPFVTVIGPTGIESLTVLDAAGELVLLQSRGDAHFLLDHRPAPQRAERVLQPASFARLLGDYRSYFDALDPEHRRR